MPDASLVIAFPPVTTVWPFFVSFFFNSHVVPSHCIFREALSPFRPMFASKTFCCPVVNGSNLQLLHSSNTHFLLVTFLSMAIYCERVKTNFCWVFRCCLHCTFRALLVIWDLVQHLAFVFTISLLLFLWVCMSLCKTIRLHYKKDWTI